MKENIPLLVFEYASGFILRENQIEIVKRLSKKEKICQQLVMGGGKTKVLLPLLALAKADGKTLSTIVVPEALFETNLHDLSQTSFKQLGQKGVAFTWDRTTPIDPAYLKERYTELQRVMENRGYLITSPNAIQSLLLKRTEIYHDLKTKDITGTGQSAAFV